MPRDAARSAIHTEPTTPPLLQSYSSTAVVQTAGRTEMIGVDRLSILAYAVVMYPSGVCGYLLSGRGVVVDT